VRIIAELNPVLRGWFRYFQHAWRTEFPGLDGFVRRRLRAVLRKQAKRPGFGRCAADHRRWPNAYFAAAGLFTVTTAWQHASQSDEETTDWRAVCGRTARTVRREGRTLVFPTPIR